MDWWGVGEGLFLWGEGLALPLVGMGGVVLWTSGIYNLVLETPPTVGSEVGPVSCSSAAIRLGP